MNPSLFYRTEWYCPTVYWNRHSDRHNYYGHYIFNWSGIDWAHLAPYANRNLLLQDYGPEPAVINIEEATEQNNNFRLALWTGKHLQVTLMSLLPDGEIGLERHADTDQFLRIEEGEGIVRMGDQPNHLSIEQVIKEDDAIMIPAGTWHNLINTGRKPLKLYSIYAPPNHPFGTVHETYAAAQLEEG